MRLTTTTAAALLAFSFTPGWAKLPPPSEETKAKASEAAARSAWTDKVGAYQSCLVMDKVAAQYLARAKTAAAGASAPMPVATPPCADPGPFAMPETPAKPLEAAGAHSPPATAVSPPSSKATDAEIKGGIKKP